MQGLRAWTTTARLHFLLCYDLPRDGLQGIFKDILEKKNVDIVRMPGGEEIVISYTDISITGTERSKPQIRVFMDKQKQVYDFARDRQMRYFLLTLFSKDLIHGQESQPF